MTRAIKDNLQDRNLNQARKAFRHVKARVDTRWKKPQPLGTLAKGVTSPRPTKRLSTFWRSNLIGSPNAIETNHKTGKAKVSSKDTPVKTPRTKLRAAEKSLSGICRKSVAVAQKEQDVKKEIASQANNIVSMLLNTSTPKVPPGTQLSVQIRQMKLVIAKAVKKTAELPIHATEELQTMSKYFIDLAVVDNELAGNSSFEIAAASLFLSVHLLGAVQKAGMEPRTLPVFFYSTYSDHLRTFTKQIAKGTKEDNQSLYVFLIVCCVFNFFCFLFKLFSFYFSF